MSWSTGLSLGELKCEVDFIAWHRAAGMLNEERDEPLLVIGEAKSFGHDAIDEKAITSLKRVAERFPGAVMVMSTLREANEFSLAEVARLRHLALWGRRSLHQGQPVNPLVVLTGTELFAQYGIGQEWQRTDNRKSTPYFDFRNLHTLSELTLLRYLGLGSYWDAQVSAPEPMAKILNLVRGRSS
jgi:hypothetical protein